ncbi:hypothetical protein D3C73_1116640 [compost metagenome]
MTDPRTVVDIIRPDGRPHELLHDIIGLIARTSGRARAHNRIRSVFLLDRAQLLRRKSYRLFPRHLLKHTFLADHRLAEAGGQQLRIIQEIPAVMAFQTKISLVRPAICRLCAHDLSILDQQIQLAAAAAIRAYSQYFIFHSLSPLLVIFCTLYTTKNKPIQSILFHTPCNGLLKSEVTQGPFSLIKPIY